MRPLDFPCHYPPRFTDSILTRKTNIDGQKTGGEAQARTDQCWSRRCTHPPLAAGNRQIIDNSYRWRASWRSKTHQGDLAGLGTSAIDLAVLTHCDADHVDGLLAYIIGEGSLPIRHYWGPCVPAFRRHDWLFGPRIARGLDQTGAVQRALPSSCNISWPVEAQTGKAPTAVFRSKSFRQPNAYLLAPTR